jgi:membrane protein
MARSVNNKRNAIRRSATENRWMRLAGAGLQKYYTDLLSVRAAALSYWSLLSMVPLLAVAFSVLKAFGVENLIETVLLEALEPLGPDRNEIARRIVGFVGNAQAGVLGAAGVAGLFYTVVSLIGNVEEALNQIWRAQPIRAWTRRYGEYLGLLLVGPVLMFAAFALIASAQSYWLVQRLIEMQLFGSMIAVLTRVLPFFFLWAGFTCLYKIMPSADVHWRSALFGAAVAAILWHLAGIAFTAFVAGSVNYTALYSGFAIVVVFFLWLNLAWLIVLFGGMVAYLHQHAPIYMRGLAVETQDPAFEEWLVLRVLCEIARVYLAGKPPLTEGQLSAGVNIPLAQIERAVDRYIRRGLLLRSAEPPGISLARPPENISAVEILQTVHGELMIPRTSEDTVVQLLHRRDLALHNGLHGIDLKTLAEESSEYTREPPLAAEVRRDH